MYICGIILPVSFPLFSSVIFCFAITSDVETVANDVSERDTKPDSERFGLGDNPRLEDDEKCCRVAVIVFFRVE